MEKGELQADIAVATSPTYLREKRVDWNFGPDAGNVGVRDLTPAVGIDKRNVNVIQAKAKSKEQRAPKGLGRIGR